MDIKVDKHQELKFSFSAEVLQVLMQGLGELQHKVAKPVELLLMQQVSEQLKNG